MPENDMGFGVMGTAPVAAPGPEPEAEPSGTPHVMVPLAQPIQQPLKKPEEMTAAELVEAVRDELTANLRSTDSSSRWRALEVLTLMRVAEALEVLASDPLPGGRG